jgi:glycosyltransferase involved in cell wall biosynthesis
VPVRLLHRQPHCRSGRLGGAVIEGARRARGEWILVMDADLQHPPEVAAVLAEAALQGGPDVLVATRYAAAGRSADGLAGKRRVLVSAWATRLAKRNPALRIAEIPYCFALRHAGESKASLREGIVFLRHVTRLKAFQFRQPPRPPAPQPSGVR